MDYIVVPLSILLLILLPSSAGAFVSLKQHTIIGTEHYKTQRFFSSNVSLNAEDSSGVVSSVNADNKIPISSSSDAQIFTPEQFGSSSVPSPPTTTITAETTDAISTTTTTTTTTTAPLPPPPTPSTPPLDKLVDDNTPMPLPAAPKLDLDTIALVAGQESYGFGIVVLGEAIWSFSKSPSVDHGLKTLLPSIISSGVMFAFAGPMITSGDAANIQTGLTVSTIVSIVMGGVYFLRLSAPYSPSPKEIPAGGMLFAVAGFFSFSQNLIVDGFIALPSLPSIDINLPF